LREVVNAIFYVMRGGIGWRLLPSDFTPRSTVLRWFCLFRDTCLFENINHKLLMLDRERCGREASPTASITSGNRPGGMAPNTLLTFRLLAAPGGGSGFWLAPSAYPRRHMRGIFSRGEKSRPK
jgi:transposase